MLPNLSSIEIDTDNPNYSSYNGMLFNKELTCLLLAPEGMEGTAVLPETLAAVPACVFSRCTKLLAISVADTGSTAISAFASDGGILYTSDFATLIAVPAGIGSSVALSDRCMRISDGAFWGCKYIQTIVSNECVSDIENTYDNTHIPAFLPETIQNTTVLTTDVDVWQKVGFTHFDIPATPGDEFFDEAGFVYTLLDDYTLSVGWSKDKPQMQTLNIPNTAFVGGVEYKVSAITASGFADVDALECVEIPSNIKTIDTCAFENCINLTTIHIEDGLETINDRAFANTSLSLFVVPSTTRHISDEVFANTDNLTIVDRYASSFVSSAVLLGANHTKVYLPYNPDNTYNWTVGLPSTGNRLLPYGARPSKTLDNLKVGQTTSLIDEDGYIYAPEDIEVVCSYKAKYISLDIEAGTITAKQQGAGSFNISFLLKAHDGISDIEIPLS